MSARVVHGESSTRKHPPSAEYSVWCGMRRRCNDEKAKDYPDYGGRGIKVCARWDDYTNFLSDMGRRPSPRHQIDRKENDVGYTPENCVWSTSRANTRNRRSNRLITFRDRTQCLAAWAEELGCSMPALKARLDDGVPLEVALTEPIRHAQILVPERDRRLLRPTRSAVEAALSAEGATSAELASATGLRIRPVRSALGRLKTAGVAERVAGGKWRRCG